MRYALAFLASIAATPALAATVTDIVSGEPGSGRRVAISESAFTGSGPCGYGGSVVNDGCSVIGKVDPSAPNAYGRFDPLDSTWIDSQDLSRLAWTHESETAFTSFTFALTDAFDQKCNDVLGCSYFLMLAGGIAWDISDRQDNGEVNWITLLFDAPTTSFDLAFETRLNDGFGISAASQIDAPPAPVPLPAGFGLLFAGLLGLSLVGVRKAVRA